MTEHSLNATYRFPINACYIIRPMVTDLQRESRYGAVYHWHEPDQLVIAATGRRQVLGLLDDLDFWDVMYIVESFKWVGFTGGTAKLSWRGKRYGTTVTRLINAPGQVGAPELNRFRQASRRAGLPPDELVIVEGPTDQG